MFSLMIQKLKRKKWLVLCMLTGNILLIAVAVSHPMYRASSFQRMLMDDFADYYEQTGDYPAVFRTSKSLIEGISNSSILEVGEEFDRAVDAIGIPVKQTVTFYQASAEEAKAAVVRDGEEKRRIRLSALSGLWDHVDIITGRLPQTAKTSDGCYEVAVSESAMVNRDLLLEEEYEYDRVVDADGDPVRIRITGVFRPSDEGDLYWMAAPSNMDSDVFLDSGTFRSSLLENGAEKKNGLDAVWYAFWDYEQISAFRASDCLNAYHKVLQWDSMKSTSEAASFETILTDYSAKAKRIEVTLIILQVPVLLLLCAFLFMISGQMLSIEQNEISLMKSRGAGKFQILSLYLMQSAFLAALSCIAGVPLGALLCRLLGSASAFLQFTSSRALELYFCSDIVWYTAAAVLASVIMTTIPVIKYSGISIVNLKQNRAQKHKSLWKKMFLDVICLAISLYGFYSYRRDFDRMAENVISGRGLDPLLYISFSLFILGLGLLICRLHPLLMKLIYKISARWLPPAGYASLLETIRTGYRQEFIMIFMMLTVAIGISNTTIARTILANATENIDYLNGAQLVVQEAWEDNSMLVDKGMADEVVYEEPDFTKYQSIRGVDTVTKVLDEKITVKKLDGADIRLLGIQTKGFAQVTDLRRNLLPYDYYDYLNVLASDRAGFLVSENFMTKAGYSLGDQLTVRDEDGGRVVGTIHGFFRYWPTYRPLEYEVSDDGEVDNVEHYLVVGNFYHILASAGMRPYEVWMSTSDGGDGMYEWADEHPKIAFQKFADQQVKKEETADSTLFQGTNGILSMSFLIILILCFAGYLIYWIMSIKSRELLFGVLRAMGMRKTEIVGMLMIEQFCSGVFAIAAGGGIGILASRMFVPMIQSAYAAADQVLPLRLITDRWDLLRLYGVIALVMCVCLIVLGRIISRMNISSALKLGED